MITVNEDMITVNNEPDKLFDVDALIQSQLENNTFKITNQGQMYDRYLVESDYKTYIEI